MPVQEPHPVGPLSSESGKEGAHLGDFRQFTVVRVVTQHLNHQALLVAKGRLSGLGDCVQALQRARDVSGFNLALGDLQHQQRVTLEGGKAIGIGSHY